jgi:hypothetical protein
MHTERMVEEGNYLEDATDDAIAHFCRLNKTTKAAFECHFNEATAENDRLSKLAWRIDFGSYAHMLNAKALVRLGFDSRQIAFLARRERRLSGGRSGFSAKWILLLPAESHPSPHLSFPDYWRGRGRPDALG